MAPFFHLQFAFAAIFVLVRALVLVYGQRPINMGICYGLKGDNLPSPADAIGLCQNHGINKVRLFEPNPAALDALRGKGFDVILGTLDADISTLASSETAADSWFRTNVQPYVNDMNIKFISLGNEIVPSEFTGSLVQAMQNLQNVLQSHGLGIKVSTVVDPKVLVNFPPSTSVFTTDAHDTMVGILQFLSAQKNPLLINVHPYFAYNSNPTMSLDYVMFTSTAPVVTDGDLSYTNLYDAMIDSFVWAMEKEGGGDVDLVVTESGWPHDGNGNITTLDLAATYNKNFLKHVGGGTPKRPSAAIDGYLFALLDEDLKPPGAEQNWGLFKPNMDPNYDIFS
ncbi:putative glucan endo-1,3-beta-glucosidase BG5 [Drosera capensis]